MRHTEATLRRLLEAALVTIGVLLIVRSRLLSRQQGALFVREAQAAARTEDLYRQQQSVLRSAGEGIWGIDAVGQVSS